MATSVNTVGYARRLAVVGQILQSYGLEASEISPVGYDEEYQYPYNNFVYKIKLASPASSSLFPGTQPGTNNAPAPPKGISVLVLKLSNLAAGMNNTNRVENDVAIHFLVRQSILEFGLGPLVPEIYAWAPAKATTDTMDETCFGWTISALKEGVDLSSSFSTLNLLEKELVLDQIAAVLTAIQAVKLPESTKFGGLTFDSAGQIVTGESPVTKEPPRNEYSEGMQAKLRRLFQQTVKSDILRGWRDNGVDDSIQRFFAAGGAERMLREVDGQWKGVIHNDMTIGNFLFDEFTKKLTAVLDFDWSYISHPFEEYTSLLSDIGCNITNEDSELNSLLLSTEDDFSWPSSLDGDETATRKLEVVKMWKTAMKKNGTLAPGEMKGIDGIRAIRHFQALLCPWQLMSEHSLLQLDEQSRIEMRAKLEADLVQWLQKYGF